MTWFLMILAAVFAAVSLVVAAAYGQDHAAYRAEHDDRRRGRRKAECRFDLACWLLFACLSFACAFAAGRYW